jgi:biopolymer transport protein TolQ
MPIIEAFRESDLFGRLILLTLFGLSIFVWSVILRKYLAFREAKQRSQEFRRAYKEFSDNPLGLVESDQYFDESPFYSICDETLDSLITVLKKKGVIDDPYDGNQVKLKMNPKHVQLSREEIDTIGKTVDATISDEVLALEKNLNLLATTAAASPLLGLLGTVWGILIAFQRMAKMQSAQIEVVTQGISVALVTTVVGLMVAIPSLVMYNYMVNIIRRFETEMESFSSEIIVDIEQKYIQKG